LKTFDPTEIHPDVHTPAQELIPRATGSKFDTKHIKVLRVSLAAEAQLADNSEE